MSLISQTLVALTQAATTAADTAATTTDATAATAATATASMGAGDILSMIIPLVLMFAVFYFLLIRPQRKKDKKVKDMLANLKPGDRVVTIGGIYGTIKGLREDSVILSVGHQNTEMIFARWAIRNVEEVTVENEGELLT